MHQADPVPKCLPFLRDNCRANGTVAHLATMFGFTQVTEAPHKPFLPNGSLPAFEQDLATFLLTRGEYAWLGYGWLGCGDARGGCSSGLYQRPAELELDYGIPMSHCVETAPDSGVFTREWTKATVQMDCNVGQYGKAKITWKGPIG